MRFLFLLFIIVPILEMVLLIKVGGIIGALPTIALVCLTAFVGVGLIRAQGFSTVQRAQQKMQQGQVPAQELVDGISLLLGGAMLLTPGFFTDGIGFLLLVPTFRKLMFHKLVARLMAGGNMQAGFQMHSGSKRAANDDPTNVYEGEFEHEDDSNKP